MIGRIAERLRFEPDRTVTVLSGKVELGQGLNDALTLICSEELALAPNRIRVRCGDTAATPDDGLTAGSGSMERAGAAVRAAARTARGELIRRASALLGVPPGRLEARSGMICRRADDTGGARDPADGKGSGAVAGPHSDRGSAPPAAGAPASGGGIDYWALLDAEELGGGQTHRSRPAAAGMPPARGDRDRSSPITVASSRSVPGDGARQVRDSSPPLHEPDAPQRATPAPNRPLAARRGESWRRVERVVRGGGNFVHDLRLPDMVHGRVLRPPGYGHRLRAVTADAARAMDGVLAVVVDGSFVAVAAQREEQAIAARDVLAASAHWQRQEPGKLHSGPRRALRDAPAETTPILHRGGAPAPGIPAEPAEAMSHSARIQAGAPDAAHPGLSGTDPSAAPHRSTRRDAASGSAAGSDPALPGATPSATRAGEPKATVTASYSRPFLMHASLGPSAAAARLDRDGGMTVWSHTQGPYELRAALAEALPRAPESIRVIHVDGAGCYGHNGADDVALDAALLALAVPERPVLVTWSREDEHRWEPYGTAMIVTCSADLDAAGSVTRWRHEVRSHAHGTRPRGTPGHSTLLAAWHRATPLTPPAPRNGTGLTAGPQRNAEPLYGFPDIAITTHFVPEAPVRVSALRSLGAFANVFAIESFMDELAARRGADPLAYRLRHLPDERARRVLTEAVHAAPGLPAPAPQAAHSDELIGRGMAVARYKNLQTCVAVVCDVAVDPGSGRIRLLHATIAADAGRIIDRDGLANQLEGGFLQAASWTLKEEVRWDRDAIRSTDWDSYPVLRFSEVPPVTVRLIDRPDLPSVGAGEAVQGPTPAAIANAVYAAAGMRLRHTPFTPARVMAALSGERIQSPPNRPHARHP